MRTLRPISGPRLSQEGLSPWLSRAIIAVIIGTTAASAIGLAGDRFWIFDLVSHFRLQYAGLVLVALMFSPLTGSRPLVAVVAVVFAVHLVPVAPLILVPDQPAGDGVDLRVVQFNVWASNDNREEAAAWLAAQSADVLVVQEVDRDWVEALDAGLGDMTRLRTDTIRSDSYGIAVYLGPAIAATDVEIVDPLSTPALAVTLPFEPIGGGSEVAEAAGSAGGPPGDLLLYAVHTLPPVSSPAVAQAQDQLDLAAERVNGHQGPVVVIGDLNTTRWGAAFNRLVDRTGLRDSGEGLGLAGTWPAPLWFLATVRIDHVLVSDDIRVLDHRTGPGLGSDHRPVAVDLTLVGDGG